MLSIALFASPTYAGSHYITIQQTNYASEAHPFVCNPDIEACIYEVPIILVNKEGGEYEDRLKIAVTIDIATAKFSFLYDNEKLVNSYREASQVELSLTDLHDQKQDIELYILNPIYKKERIRNNAVMYPRNKLFTVLSMSMVSPEHTPEIKEKKIQKSF